MLRLFLRPNILETDTKTFFKTKFFWDRYRYTQINDVPSLKFPRVSKNEGYEKQKVNWCCLSNILANILGSIWIPFAVYTLTSILLNCGTVFLLSLNYGQIILINFERNNITFKMYLEGYMAVRGGNFLSGPSPRPIKIALIQFPITCSLWIKQEFLALKHKNGLSWLILKFCFPQRNIALVVVEE